MAVPGDGAVACLARPAQQPFSFFIFLIRATFSSGQKQSQQQFCVQQIARGLSVGADLVFLMKCRRDNMIQSSTTKSNEQSILNKNGINGD